MKELEEEDILEMNSTQKTKEPDPKERESYVRRKITVIKNKGETSKKEGKGENSNLYPAQA